MSLDKSHGYVSIVGFNYIQPICTLLEKLLSLDSKDPNEVQASQAENGYSSAIIMLTMLLVESAIARVKYDLDKTSSRSPLEFVRTELPSFTSIDKLEELFVVRDVIAHNHVWEAKFLRDDNAGLRLIAAELRRGYGDRKFGRVLNQETRKTRLLGVNLFPTRIWRDDAIIVLKAAIDFLLFLQEEVSGFVNISNQYEIFNGELQSFTDVVAKL